MNELLVQKNYRTVESILKWKVGLIVIKKNSLTT